MVFFPLHNILFMGLLFFVPALDGGERIRLDSGSAPKGAGTGIALSLLFPQGGRGSHVMDHAA